MASSRISLRSMVASGMGITILSDIVYRPWSLEGRRVEVKALTDNIPSMDVGIAWARDVELNPSCLAFREFMHTGKSA